MKPTHVSCTHDLHGGQVKSGNWYKINVWTEFGDARFYDEFGYPLTAHDNHLKYTKCGTKAQWLFKTEEDMQTGTLKELNVQVGDVVEWISGETAAVKIRYSIERITNERYYHDGDQLIESGQWRIISRANQSPVREVTRKEIVPGVYGEVKVHDPGSKYVRINIDAAMDITALREAIGTLQQIADAMEE